MLLRTQHTGELRSFHKIESKGMIEPSIIMAPQHTNRIEQVAMLDKGEPSSIFSARFEKDSEANLNNSVKVS